MKIVFVIKALSSEGGGAERVLVEVASGLARRGHSVCVVTSDAVGAESFYPLAPQVSQINLGIGSVSEKTSIVDAIRRTFALRRVVKNAGPDVVVGFMNSSYMLLFIALQGLRIPLVASEHVGPEYYESRPFQRLLSRFMPFVARKIVVVTEQVRLKFSPKVHEMMRVIPNPVSFGPAHRSDLHGDERSSMTLLAIGRLDAGKNHRELIEAFALIADQVPDWNLRIVGEGALRRELQEHIAMLHLEARVQLIGSTRNILDEYLNAQLFVSPSLYESFGLVVAEALIHGLPVVGFADCPGINQLICPNENGLLVGGHDRIGSLAVALKSLMLNADERIRLGSAPVDWLIEKYDINAILDLWEQLLNECVGP